MAASPVKPTNMEALVHTRLLDSSTCHLCGITVNITTFFQEILTDKDSLQRELTSRNILLLRLHYPMPTCLPKSYKTEVIAINWQDSTLCTHVTKCLHHVSRSKFSLEVKLKVSRNWFDSKVTVTRRNR